MARPKNTENAVARRDELINASAKLFNKLGFQRTTVRNIAEEIGITSGSIFYHFDNKEQLLEAFVNGVPCLKKRETVCAQSMSNIEMYG